MKKIILSLAMIGLAVATTGCEEKIHTYDYYANNLKEAKQKKIWCKKQDSLTKTQTEECNRAKAAYFNRPLEEPIKTDDGMTEQQIMDLMDGKSIKK